MNEMPKTAERQSQVSEQLSRNMLLMENLGKSLSLLKEKIIPILLDKDDLPATIPGNPPKTMVALASTLKERNDMLEIQTEMIFRLIRGIEL